LSSQKEFLSATMLSLVVASPLALAPTVITPRCGAPMMGFGPSEKELSNDPTIPSVLAKCKVEQRERMARVAAMAAGGFVPGGQDLALEMPGKAPWGFFDPLGMVPECRNEVRLWREAEVMHGRVAMMAAVGIVVQEAFHPIFSSVGGPAARQLDEVLKTETGQAVGVTLLLVIFLTEIYRARIGWVEPETSVRTLREGYTPGNLGFDPMGLDAPGMADKELNNGRLAMIATAGFVGQELATGAPLFVGA
jgi:light-harvesting complex I chlorophyll a/b binding protein 4